MIPIVTPAQMNEADAAVTAAPASQISTASQLSPASQTSTATLIKRAGTAVAFEARAMMGGTYGRRVLVVCGAGNNGADGAIAAETLRSWGARCDVLAPAAVSERAQGAPHWLAANDCGECFDLVIDAAFGTGLRSPWQPGPQPSAPVLAVDVASGIDALTGYDHGSWAAAVTLTFAALKPGLLLHPAAAKTGQIKVVDLGEELAAAVSERAQAHLLTDLAADEALGEISTNAHKWQTAVRVVAGSKRYQGAGHLASAAALAAGAGMVTISSPGCCAEQIRCPLEAVAVGTTERWLPEVQKDIDRFGLLVIGPGLGTGGDNTAVCELIATCPQPVVIDADALAAVAADPSCVQRRLAPTVLTPHEGEFNRLVAGLSNSQLKPDSLKQNRFRAVLEAAQYFNSVVLLKGPTTLVATPAEPAGLWSNGAPGHVYAVTSGSQRLATAGSGDVLTGVIAGALARALASEQVGTAGAMGLRQLAQLVAAAAHWHGRTTAVSPAGQPFSTPLTATEQIALLPPARAIISGASPTDANFSGASPTAASASAAQTNTA